MPPVPRTRRGLLRWLTVADLPIFVVDSRRVVLFFNRGCEELTGWSAADVIGKTCEYATDPDPASVESVTSRLCPPADAFDSPHQSRPVDLIHRNGNRATRTIHYFSLESAQEGTAHVLGVCLPGESAIPPAPLASESAQLRRTLARLQDELHRRYDEQSLIGVSPPLRRLREQVRIAAVSSAAVHLSGPPGSGKEHLAQVIHQAGPHPLRAFVPLDCRKLPPFDLKRSLRKLLEEDSIEGAGENPHQAGAVFIKHVSLLPRDVQEIIASWDAAQDSARTQIKLLTADEQPLDPLLHDETLLPEFFYLITQQTIIVPSLAGRREDVPLLAQHLLERLNVGSERQVDGLTPDGWELVRRYDWPGNVAELLSVLKEARAGCRTHLISAADLPFRFRAGMDGQSVGPSMAPVPVSLEQLLAEVEADYIRWALEQAKGNKSGAAALLGFTRPRLYRRMEALRLIDPDDESSVADLEPGAG